MSSSTHGVDLLLTAIGILYLIARQFTWRHLTTANLFIIPLLLVSSGVIGMGMNWGVLTALPFTRFIWLAIGVEALVAMLTGLAMGWLTQFRMRPTGQWYRLGPKGVVLWAMFVGLRVASLYWFKRMGAQEVGAPGGLLSLFGTNRLVSGLTIQQRFRLRP
jgi:hypothetical protein